MEIESTAFNQRRRQVLEHALSNCLPTMCSPLRRFVLDYAYESIFGAPCIATSHLELPPPLSSTITIDKDEYETGSQSIHLHTWKSVNQFHRLHVRVTFLGHLAHLSPGNYRYVQADRPRFAASRLSASGIESEVVIPRSSETCRPCPHLLRPGPPLSHVDMTLTSTPWWFGSYRVVKVKKRCPHGCIFHEYQWRHEAGDQLVFCLRAYARLEILDFQE